LPVTTCRLQQVWLFATTPLEALEALAASFVTRHCVAGEVIYHEVR